MKIVLSLVIALFMIGCSENKKAEEKVVETKKVNVAEEQSALDKASDKVEEVKEELETKVEEVKESVSDSVKEVKEEIASKVEETKANVSETTKDVMDTIKDKTAAITGEKIDAELLYDKCTGCHGGMGEYSALGKSAVIRNWSSKQIESALLGYKNGTYGRTMKGMMQNQVKNLSDAEIHALANYISDK